MPSGPNQAATTQNDGFRSGSVPAHPTSFSASNQQYQKRRCRHPPHPLHPHHDDCRRSPWLDDQRTHSYPQERSKKAKQSSSARSATPPSTWVVILFGILVSFLINLVAPVVRWGSKIHTVVIPTSSASASVSASASFGNSAASEPKLNRAQQEQAKQTKQVKHPRTTNPLSAEPTTSSLSKASHRSQQPPRNQTKKSTTTVRRYDVKFPTSSPTPPIPTSASVVSPASPVALPSTTVPTTATPAA